MEESAILQLLRAQLPERETLIVGWAAIEDYLWTLGVRSSGMKRITMEMIRTLVKMRGFPLLKGSGFPVGGRKPPITTNHAITAWLLSQRSSGERRGLRFTQSQVTPRTESRSGPAACSPRQTPCNTQRATRLGRHRCGRIDSPSEDRVSVAADESSTNART